MTERPGHNFQQGSVITTGQDLDVTIQDQGWIAVLTTWVKRGLTRNGNLNIDVNEACLLLGVATWYSVRQGTPLLSLFQ